MFSLMFSYFSLGLKPLALYSDKKSVASTFPLSSYCLAVVFFKVLIFLKTCLDNLKFRICDVFI